jgi:hypothetical protein
MYGESACRQQLENALARLLRKRAGKENGMTIQEVLKRPEAIMKEIVRLEADYAFFRARAYGGTSRANAVRYGGTAGRSRLEEAVVALDEIQGKLKRQHATLRTARRMVRKAAAGMPTPRMRLLVVMRYVHMKTWPEVAGALGCSERWAKALGERVINGEKEVDRNHAV